VKQQSLKPYHMIPFATLKMPPFDYGGYAVPNIAFASERIAFTVARTRKGGMSRDSGWMGDNRYVALRSGLEG
jgi:hypothetical protein